MKTNTATFDKSGRIVIPAEYRKALGVKPGDEVIVKLEDGSVRLFTLEQAIKEAQEIVRRHVPPGVSLVDELLQDRRDEVARESRE